MTAHSKLADAFRGFLPIVIDIETAGFDSKTHALLEIAALVLDLDNEHKLYVNEVLHWHVTPFEGSILDPKALAFNKIDPTHPFRNSVLEVQMLRRLNDAIKVHLKRSGCHKAVLVGHNAAFDLSFLMAAYARNTGLKCPFHSFTTIDTATLGAVCYGHTVLSQLMARAGIPHSSEEAHSAIYDATNTATLFCKMANRIRQTFPQT